MQVTTIKRGDRVVLKGELTATVEAFPYRTDGDTDYALVVMDHDGLPSVQPAWAILQVLST